MHQWGSGAWFRQWRIWYYTRNVAYFKGNLTVVVKAVGLARSKTRAISIISWERSCAFSEFHDAFCDRCNRCPQCVRIWTYWQLLLLSNWSFTVHDQETDFFSKRKRNSRPRVERGSIAGTHGESFANRVRLLPTTTVCTEMWLVCLLAFSLRRVSCIIISTHALFSEKIEMQSWLNLLTWSHYA